MVKTEISVVIRSCADVRQQDDYVGVGLGSYRLISRRTLRLHDAVPRLTTRMLSDAKPRHVPKLRVLVLLLLLRASLWRLHPRTKPLVQEPLELHLLLRRLHPTLRLLMLSAKLKSEVEVEGHSENQRPLPKKWHARMKHVALPLLWVLVLLLLLPRASPRRLHPTLTLLVL